MGCKSPHPYRQPGQTVTHSVTTTCTGGTDNAGNCADNASVTYTVEYAFLGLQAPVNPIALIRVKAGAAVPVKFGLSGDQGMGVLSGAPRAVSMSCAGLVDPLLASETAIAGASSLQYDGVSDTYTHVWKTDKAWAGQCRQCQLKLADGTTQTANFQLAR
jgi:hypothetical protein